MPTFPSGLATVAVMCPTMSLVASVLFNIVPGSAPLTQLPAVWAGTVLKNFPMAFFWNMFVGSAVYSLDMWKNIPIRMSGEFKAAKIIGCSFNS